MKEENNSYLVKAVTDYSFKGPYRPRISCRTQLHIQLKYNKPSIAQLTLFTNLRFYQRVQFTWCIVVVG